MPSTKITAPNHLPSNKNSSLLWATLLGLATIALYWPAMQCDFISYDDPDYVTANDLIQNG
jgi:hypothetical protein